MNKFVCMRKIWVSASMVLCIMLAGCITARDLDRIADAHRMQIDIKKSTRKTLDTPFQREKLVGKWVGEYQVQELIWCQDQSYKKFPVSKWRMEYEFQQDGKYITTSYLNGSFNGRAEGTWIYCVNINGLTEITFQGQGVERPYWSVFWYGEDELALAHRNGNMAGKIHVDGLKNTYDATWATDWLYIRDIYLNEKFLGTAIMSPYISEIPEGILDRNNTLRIVVTNTSANRYVHTDYFNKWKTEELSPYFEPELKFAKDFVSGGLYGPVKLYTE